MVDIERLRLIVARGLKDYLKCPVIKSNQNADPPDYPYVSYTITTVASENRGTYQEHSDGIARKSVNTTMSITVQSNDHVESVTLAQKAHDWIDYAGTVYLNDNDVIVQSVTSVTNRDNVLTSEFEYRNGFDCIFWCYDEVKMPEGEEIKEIVLGDDLNDRLEARLDGVNRFALTGDQKQTSESDALNDELENRLNGAKKWQH